MSKIEFRCPGCGHNLTVRSGADIKSVDDIDDTACANCGRVIHKADITTHARNHNVQLIRDMLEKHFK